MKTVCEKSSQKADLPQKAPRNEQKVTPRPRKLPAKTRTDVIVTARVPAAVKEQGNAVLREIGSTPTELINSAYQYVLSNKKIPAITLPLSQVGGSVRIPTEKQINTLRERVKRTTFTIPDSYWRKKTDKELLEEALREKYETIS